MSCDDNSFRHPDAPSFKIRKVVKTKKTTAKTSPSFSHPSLPVKYSEQKDRNASSVTIPDGVECDKSTLSETGAVRQEIFRQLSKIRSGKDLLQTAGRTIDKPSRLNKEIFQTYLHRNENFNVSYKL